MADIFTPAELASYLQQDVDTATTLLLRNLVTGLISEVTGVDYTTTVTIPAAVKAVALESVARAYRNPHGLTQFAIDDYSARMATTSGVHLLPEEVERLNPTPTSRDFVRSIRLGSPFGYP